LYIFACDNSGTWMQRICVYLVKEACYRGNGYSAPQIEEFTSLLASYLSCSLGTEHSEPQITL